jgi:diaminopimelate epimerase
MAGLAFTKMHGLGNDFVLLDLRGGRPAPERALVQAMADRHRGVGFDQLITIEDAARDDCAFGYRIWNRDGSAAEQCGNGARCVVAWLAEAGAVAGAAVALEAPGGKRIDAERHADGTIRLAMGVPDFDPAAVGFAAAGDAPVHTLDIYEGKTELGVVSMGNPHAVIEVRDVDTALVDRIGPRIERHPAFGQGCNVGFVQRVDAGHLKLRVWERGVGETEACGSGACAAMAVLRRRHRVADAVAVDLPGGRLTIDWAGPGQPLYKTGPATFVFDGVWRR